MSWSLCSRWAPLRDEAPDLDALRHADPPAIALSAGLPERLSPAVRQLAQDMQITWLEAPWPDANVDSLDTDDRGLRSATVRAVVRTVEGANAMECPRVVCAVSTAGDALRFALDSVLASAERQGLMLGLRGPVEPSALRGLLREYEGAPLGWILELTHSDDLADAADGRVLACVLPNDDDADLGRWRDRIDPATARVFDPDPGSEPDELHERAAAMLADLARSHA